MDKQYRALKDFEPTADGDKRAALRLNELVELTDAEAKEYGELVDAVSPYTVRSGRYTQTDADGKPHEFGPGDTILLRGAELKAIGDEKFAPVKAAEPPPAPKPLPAGGGPDSPTP